jgi:hypothetical protein
MPIWGNNDSANSKPLLPVERQVREIAILYTANSTTSGSNVTFTTPPPASLVGAYVYTTDAAQGLSRFTDTSIIDSNDVAFLKSNNTVAAVDTANSAIRLANNVIATLASGQPVYFANAIIWTTGSDQANTYFSDTILVTASRAANGNNAIANVGSLSTGWVHIQKKTNNDGTVRYLKETLIALANSAAANVSSGNTSFGSIVTGT